MERGGGEEGKDVDEVDARDGEVGKGAEGVLEGYLAGLLGGTGGRGGGLGEGSRGIVVGGLGDDGRVVVDHRGEKEEVKDGEEKVE